MLQIVFEINDIPDITELPSLSYTAYYYHTLFFTNHYSYSSCGQSSSLINE